MLSAAADEVPSGSTLFARNCADCHDHGQARIPGRDQLAQRTPDELVQVMTSGAMRNQAIALSIDEKRSVATFLTGRAPSPLSVDRDLSNRCVDAAEIEPLRQTSQWNGWGRDLDNSRYQPDPKLSAADVPRLKLKWAYGYDSMVYGQPTLVGGRVYVTTITGRILALDARTGCAYWAYDATASARTAITVGSILEAGATRTAAFFGDDAADVYAVDAANGALIWKTRVEEHVAARITGAPALYDGRLYVPVSSVEEALAMKADYACCTFRGSLVALDAATGSVLWKTYMIGQTPAPYRVTGAGVQQFGPAGAAAWSAPTIDTRRKLLYVGTGNSYTDVPADTSDAILALQLATGQIAWTKQFGSADNFVVGCSVTTRNNCIPGPGLDCKAPGAGNCPATLGRDFDFGGSPILRAAPPGAPSVIIAAQKSGWVYGLDADRAGAVLWRSRVGRGSALGGIEWGPAADADTVYVANSDILPLHRGRPGGLAALKIRSGERVWYVAARQHPCSWVGPGCSAAQSQAVTLIPGVVFSGAVDGHLRGYATRDGRIVWDFDTAREFSGVNGVKAVGGSLNSGGPVVADGMLFVNSGYSPVIGQRGNALLVFSVDGR